MDNYLKCENLGGLAGIYPEVAIFALPQLRRLVDVTFFLVIADIQAFALRLG